MSRAKMMRLVILPQALRIVVPPLGNYFISLFKDTALVLHDHGEGADLHRADHRRDQLPVLHDLHDRRDDLPRAVYPGSLGVQYLERRMRIGYRRPRTPALESAAQGAA